jgi:hypothetical protein
MSNELLINVTPNETRVALIESGFSNTATSRANGACFRP